MNNKKLAIGIVGAIVLVVVIAMIARKGGEAPTGNETVTPPPVGTTVPSSSGTHPPTTIKKTTPPPSKTPPSNVVLPPKAPTELSATATSPSKVKLRWRSADPSAAGFNVSRSTRADSNFETIEPVYELDTEAFYFTAYDSTVESGKTYWYHISAFNTSGDSTATNAVSVTVPNKPSSTPPPPQPVAVTISNFSFNPGSITVPKGTTVTWTNLDTTAHTVTSDFGTLLSSPLLNQGMTYSFTFDTAGTYTYHCTPHPNMKGTVIVQ